MKGDGDIKCPFGVITPPLLAACSMWPCIKPRRSFGMAEKQIDRQAKVQHFRLGK